jgi:hypothetical protein
MHHNLLNNFILAKEVVWRAALSTGCQGRTCADIQAFQVRQRASKSAAQEHAQTVNMVPCTSGLRMGSQETVSLRMCAPLACQLFICACFDQFYNMASADVQNCGTGRMATGSCANARPENHFIWNDLAQSACTTAFVLLWAWPFCCT